jgi:hypothetical protein
MKPRAWVELCAGSAAVAIRLVGGPHAQPPISYRGGKRGYARAILGVLGLRQGLGACQVILNDPGPWGAVWGVLCQPGAPGAVAEIIRGWKDEEPRPLWERLKGEGWGELETVEDVAGWIHCASQSFRVGEPESGFNPSVASGVAYNAPPSEIASRVEAVARWLVCGAWAFRQGNPANGYNRTMAEGANPDAVHVGNFGTIKPDSAPRVAGRIHDTPLSAVPCTTYQRSALDVPIPLDCTGVYVYADPPYQDTTGYQHDLGREEVLTLARDWDRAGATVCISEAEPLPLEGWHHVEITGERKGQKRTFSKQQGEWLTLNRAPSWKPGRQLAMFGSKP